MASSWASDKSQSSSQRLFATLLPCTCKYFFSSSTFILTKLGFISLTLKILVTNNIKLKVHSYFAGKDFTPHKPHFRATFSARPRVTGNSKLDNSVEFYQGVFFCCRNNTTDKSNAHEQYVTTLIALCFWVQSNVPLEYSELSVFNICSLQPLLRDPSDKEFGGYVGFQEG